MKKIVGQVISKSTGIVYSVKWNVDSHESWIQSKGFWQQVCTEVRSAEDAISCAQRFIDGQSDIF